MQSSHVWPKDKANVCAGEPSFGFQNKELEHLLLVKDMFPICKLQQLSPPFDQAMQCNVLQAGPEIVIWEIYMRDLGDVYGHSTAGTVKYTDPCYRF